MPYFDFVWELTDDGNMEHIGEHGLTPDDVEPIVLNPDYLSISRSSGRPMAFGYTSDGRYVAVVYEQLDEFTVYPITAFEVED
ncbi:MAG: hypothetical protein JWM11_110 [Planctomycetaceae bacterium]|nr:hypothetical protein [Planctomycetaceae bacterium]